MTTVEPITIDCRGLQCPAPILRVAEAARKYKGSARTITVLATDQDFPADLEAWCRTTQSSLDALDVAMEQGGFFRARITLPHGEAGRAAASPKLKPISSVERVDLSGLTGAVAARRLADAAVRSKEPKLHITWTTGEVESKVMGWASIMDAKVGPIERAAGRSSAEVTLPKDDPDATRAPASAGGGATTPAAQPAPSLLSYEAPLAQTAMVPSPPSDVAARENRCSLLVLHNDLEGLLAAMMVANASAAQGMKVDVFFSFWGVNLLRGEEPRAGEAGKRPSLLQRIMRWLMPKGPRRQRLGKMHMAGVGTRVMGLIMKRSNALSLDELLKAAVSLDVRFVVCSMSMGLMGIERRDIMDLPNVEFGGVASFAEAARRSSFSLVF